MSANDHTHLSFLNIQSCTSGIIVTDGNSAMHTEIKFPYGLSCIVQFKVWSEICTLYASYFSYCKYFRRNSSHSWQSKCIDARAGRYTGI